MNHPAIQASIAVTVGILLAHAIVLPLLRRRPIILSRRRTVLVSAMIILYLLILGLYPLTLLAAAGLLWMVYTHVWFVAGLRREDRLEATDRTIRGTMASAEVVAPGDSIRFADGGFMRFRYIPILNMHVCLQRMPKSAKNILFQEVLCKMIDNYSLTV
jgi:hypothetical protein